MKDFIMWAQELSEQGENTQPPGFFMAVIIGRNLEHQLGEEGLSEFVKNARKMEEGEE